MAIPTPTERINRLEQLGAVVTIRIDSADAKFTEFGSRLEQVDLRVQQIDRRLAVLEEIAARQEKTLADYLDRRWDVAKIVLTAVVAAAVGTLKRGLPGR